LQIACSASRIPFGLDLLEQPQTLCDGPLETLRYREISGAEDSARASATCSAAQRLNLMGDWCDLLIDPH